jgi:hypothetical protein
MLLLRRDNSEGEPMAKVTSNHKRQAWSPPELRRIRAGSAETVDNTGNADGPAGGSKDKS